MHITDIVREATDKKTPRLAVELLPPLKGEGTQRIFDALDPLR